MRSQNGTVKGTVRVKILWFECDSIHIPHMDAGGCFGLRSSLFLKRSIGLIEELSDNSTTQ